MNIAIPYFSATSNTRKMAKVIKGQFEDLHATVELHDVTTPESRSKNISLSAYDAAIFGFPVHSLRAPRLMRDWLKTLDGKGMKCGMFFTFGGFMVHPAHYSTKEILTARNFIVFSSAEFPGKHTYNHGGWNAFPDRPDDREIKLAEKYTKATYERFKGQDKGVLGDLEKTEFSDEQLDAFESFRFKMVTKLPSRNGNTCSMCEICEKLCPTGAMDCQTGTANTSTCIACLRCVDVCPDKALTINNAEESWATKLSMGKITETELNNQTGKIYL